MPNITWQDASHHLCKEMPINKNRAEANSYEIPNAIPSEMSWINNPVIKIRTDVQFFF